MSGISNLRDCYLKYLEKTRPLIAKDSYRFVSLESLPGWETIMGLQFESLIMNNMQLLMHHARIDRALLESSAPFVQRGDDEEEGFQIDLLMKASRALYVVEIKRRERIGEGIIKEVQNKIRKMRVKRGHSVFPILVYAGELSKRVPAEGYFSSVISVEEMMGICTH